MTAGRLAFASYSSGWAFSLPTKEAYADELALVGATSTPDAASTATTITAGVLFASKFRAWGASASKVIVSVSVAQVGATSAFVAIYKADGTQNPDMVTASVDAKVALGGVGAVTINLTNAVALVPGQDYYVAVLVTGAPGTALQLSACVAGVIVVNGNVTAASGYRGLNSGAGLAALPASINLATSTLARVVWAGLQ